MAKAAGETAEAAGTSADERPAIPAERRAAHYSARAPRDPREIWPCGHSPGPQAVAAAGRMLAIMNGISAKLALRDGLLFPDGGWRSRQRGVRGRVSRGRAFRGRGPAAGSSAAGVFRGRVFRGRVFRGRAFRARDCCRRARCHRRLRLSPLGPFLLQFPPGRLPAVRLPSRGPLCLIPVAEFSVRERVFGTARRPSPAQSRELCQSLAESSTQSASAPGCPSCAAGNVR